MSQPNREAKRIRHQKLFEGHYHTLGGKLWFHFKRILKFLLFKLTPSKRLSDFMHPLDHMPAPKRLYTQLAIWSIALLLLTSINYTPGAYAHGEGVNLEYLEVQSTDTLVSDDEGYLVKSMPLEGVPTFDLNRTEMLIHEVQPGDTLSTVAYQYGLEIQSIRYSNSLRGDFLRIGQELNIPPKDGLYVEVKKGDSLVKLVEEYKGNVDETRSFNSVADDLVLVDGAKLFIIDGEPKPAPVTIASTYSRESGSSGVPATAPTSLPVSGDWIRPTTGGITQGYHGGHLAYDIGDRSKPGIVAAAGGTVIKAAYGWNGGYGNHIIIDHGNGYQSLYAHCEELYVEVGDELAQGDLIAKMGNTGRVYGATGIHLHFELRYEGVKQSPSIMGVW